MTSWIPWQDDGDRAITLFFTSRPSEVLKHQGERFTTHLYSVIGYTSGPLVGYAI